MHPLIIWFLALAVNGPSSETHPILTDEPPPCGMDPFEPNDQRSKAKLVSKGPMSARLCRGDEDWFIVDLARGSRVEIILQHAKNGRLEAALYPPRARKPRGRLRHTTGRTRIAYRARRPGKHRLRIRSKSSTDFPYTMEIRER